MSPLLTTTTTPHITEEEMRRLGLSEMREGSIYQGGNFDSLSLSSLGVRFDAVESLTVTDDDLFMPLKECMGKK